MTSGSLSNHRAPIELADQLNGIEAQHSRDVNQLDRVQAPFAGFIARYELLMRAKQPRDAFLAQAGALTRLSQLINELPVPFVLETLCHPRSSRK